MNVSQTIANMEAAGMTAEAIVLALKCIVTLPVIDPQAERRRAADRDRKRLRNSAESAETPSPLVPPLEVSPAPLPKTPPIIPPTEQTKRGTRLPADFEPDASCQAVAEELLLTAPQSQAIFAEFTDHWKSAPGQRGVKLDWQATFRNWLRNNAHKHKGKQNGSYRESNNSIDRSLRVVSAVADESIRRAGGLGESGGLTDSEKLSRLWQSVR